MPPAILDARPDLKPEQLKRTRRLMNQYGGECLVTHYKHLIPTLDLPDPNDRHVLAAAIAARAHVIVTFNLLDFPANVLEPYNVVATHPDKFTANLYDRNPTEFIRLVGIHRIALLSPAKSVDEYLATLEACELGKTVEILRAHSGEI
jgi:hypothetical protein